MKFSELSPNAQNVAIKDYITGWKETHPDETLSEREARSLCLDSEDDVDYNDDGVLQ